MAIDVEPVSRQITERLDAIAAAQAQRERQWSQIFGNSSLQISENSSPPSSQLIQPQTTSTATASMDQLFSKIFAQIDQLQTEIQLLHDLPESSWSSPIPIQPLSSNFAPAQPSSAPQSTQNLPNTPSIDQNLQKQHVLSTPLLQTPALQLVPTTTPLVPPPSSSHGTSQPPPNFQHLIPSLHKPTPADLNILQSPAQSTLIPQHPFSPSGFVSPELSIPPPQYTTLGLKVEHELIGTTIPTYKDGFPFDRAKEHSKFTEDDHSFFNYDDEPAFGYRIDEKQGDWWSVGKDDGGGAKIMEPLSSQEVDLLKVVKYAFFPDYSGDFGLPLPCFIRLADVLHNRLESIHSALNFAIQSQGYESPSQGFFQVQCKQDCSVVQDILKMHAHLNDFILLGINFVVPIAVDKFSRVGVGELQALHYKIKYVPHVFVKMIFESVEAQQAGLTHVQWYIKHCKDANSLSEALANSMHDFLKALLTSLCENVGTFRDWCCVFCSCLFYGIVGQDTSQGVDDHDTFAAKSFTCLIYEGKVTNVNHAVAITLQLKKRTQAGLNVQFHWDENLSSLCSNDDADYADGALVLGESGDRGVKGKIEVVKYNWENRILYVGMYLGMQVSVIEYAGSGLGSEDAFEVSAKFCCGSPINLCAENLVAALCAVKFRRMTEAIGKGNFDTKIEDFFASSILDGWINCITTLDKSAMLSEWFGSLVIIRKCIDSMAENKLTNASKVTWSFTYSRPFYDRKHHPEPKDVADVAFRWSTLRIVFEVFEIVRCEINRLVSEDYFIACSVFMKMWDERMDVGSLINATHNMVMVLTFFFLMVQVLLKTPWPPPRGMYNRLRRMNFGRDWLKA